MHILITDASYKHSIAIQRYIRRAFASEVTLSAHDETRSVLPRLYRHLDGYVSGRPLAAILEERRFDMVIPVGARSVRQVAAICPDRAVLPSLQSLDACSDKAATVLLAQRVNVRAPITSVIREVDGPVSDQIGFPCVVKAASETEAKGVRYAHSRVERDVAIRAILSQLPRPNHGVLVQQYVEGSGHGFFALYDHGVPVRGFMHQRLRELPVTGGASTAARSFYDVRLRDAGMSLLTELSWHGVAMVEFKRDAQSGDFVLMEINGKFWGSSELALAAGVNFGADLVRVFRGEALKYSEAYDRDCHFYWPLDGDVLGLWQTRRLSNVREYARPAAKTNLGQSLPADVVRAARTIRHLLAGSSRA
jgi:biotin carboxylase